MEFMKCISTSQELQLENNSAHVRDLWLHQDLGVFTGAYSTNISSHGTAFIKVTPESSENED